MSSRDLIAKIFVLTFFSALIVTSVAGSQFQVYDGSAWLNSNKNVMEVKGTCDANYTSNITFRSPESSNFESFYNVDNISTSELADSSLETGEYNVSLECIPQKENLTLQNKGSKRILLNELKVSVAKDGKGFVNERLENDDTPDFNFKEPAEVILSAEGPEKLTQKMMKGFQFKFPSEADLGDKYQIIEGDKSYKVVLKPLINEYVENLDLHIIFESGTASVKKTLKPDILSWNAVKVGEGNPGRELRYEDIKNGEYSYNLKVSYKGKMPGEKSLEDKNFRLTVKKQKKGVEFPVYVKISDDYTEKAWLKQDEPKEGPGNYKVSLDNLYRIDKLSPGNYKFILEVKYQNRNGGIDEFTVDTLIVDKGSAFSGVVQDSAGNGVKTEMVLRKNDITKKVSAGSDGIYSAEITNDVYDSVSLDFFYRERPGADSSLTIKSPDLGSNTDLGKSGAAIGYQYWSNPKKSLEIPGMSPINMMAAKFAYHIKGGVSNVKIKFNPKDVNPEKIQVYECNYWNFEGKRCLGRWEKVPENKVSINPRTWMANLKRVNLYKTPEGENILMNAYAVGVPSKLTLKGDTPLSINNDKIEAGGTIYVNGTTVTEKGQNIKDVNVTVNLLDEDGSKVKSFESQSDMVGRFSAKGSMPDEKGKYRMKIKLEKSPYVSFEMTSKKAIKTYYTRGIELSTPEKPNLKMGEESKIGLSLKNTGQTTINNIELSVSGLKEEYYGLENVPSELEPESTKIVNLVTDLPEDFCSYPCNPPIIELSVRGEAQGKGLEHQTSMYSQVNQEELKKSKNSSSPQKEKVSASGDGMFSPIQNPVGKFLESQSDVNIALGMILMFSIILVVSVKKKKSTSSNSQRMRGARRSMIQKPKIKSGPGRGKPGIEKKKELQENKMEEAFEKGRKEESEEEIESPDEDLDDEFEDMEEEIGEDEEVYVCEETGEVFDTKEALELYKEMHGLN